MKKLLILTCAFCVIAGSANAAEAENVPAKKMPPNHEQMTKQHKAREAAFEKKLGLTDEQKTTAKELRKAGHAKMKPVMEEMRAKRQEARAISKQTELTEEAKEQKLKTLDNDLKTLEKKAQEIRKQNMKDFESILTFKQKRILKKMKKEGRERFERERRLVPPPCPMPEK